MVLGLCHNVLRLRVLLRVHVHKVLHKDLVKVNVRKALHKVDSVKVNVRKALHKVDSVKVVHKANVLAVLKDSVLVANAEVVVSNFLPDGLMAS